ncbi:MAG: GGDEF domain-containing protein [Candidatus Contendobacter sp.]|jgi:diguanylate cyclase (GGDEF)-like protein|nr:GGDEF domain-containing protein [Gammaproteobacteria bacterium]MCC8994390.1 GGDEF domain-containing protein [Candidatus Contendobacter sp.]
MHAELEQRLRFCGNLPSLPAVALQVIDLANNPDVQLNDLAKAIELDPALVTKLFRAANSPLYGTRRQATNLRQVLNLLGLQGTLVLALGFSLMASSPTATTKLLDTEQFWRRSLLTATACRILGEQLALKTTDELFLAGLLHGIGILVLTLMMPEDYSRLLRQATDPQEKRPAILDCGRLAGLEREQLDADHAEVGAWLLRYWQLPESICHAVAGSLDPTSATGSETQQRQAQCVALAIRIADIWIRPSDWQLSPQIAALAQQWFGLGEDDYMAVLEAMGEKFPEIANLFQICSLDALEIAGILDQAREVLAIRNAAQHQSSASPRALPDGSVQPALSPPRPTPATTGSATHSVRSAASTFGLRHYSFDALTGLFNRQSLDDCLRQELASARSRGWPLSLALIDLDGCAQINDTYGHAVSDQLLIALAGLLGGSIRRQDLVTRYDEDGFALLLPASGLKVARPLLDRLLALIRSWRPDQSSRRSAALNNESLNRVRLRVSVGLATYSETDLTECDSADQLLEAVEYALNQAKAEGGDRLVVYGE